MLILAVLLIILGAALVYYGRPREQLFVFGGGAIFVVGIILLILWALDRGDVETDALILLRA